MAAIRLVPHPATPGPAVASLTVTVTRGADLRLAYDLRGDLDAIALPPLAMPGFADDLWRHTCFEAFIGREGGPDYVEYNFSPSGRWAVYSFADTRQRVDLDHAGLAPTMDWRHRDGRRLTLDATVPLARLPRLAGAVLLVGASAVIETRDGAQSFWAFHHADDRPDFHRPEARTLRLEPPRR
ncbi:MAG: DOMON-like domain-containing protein [Candidatus Binatia bacterium]